MSGWYSALPILSRDEERAVATRVRMGDQAARTRMIECNIKLVVALAAKFNNLPFEMDDLIAIGAYGLIKAVDTFNPEAGFKFSTYASYCIRNSILMALREHKRHPYISLNTTFQTAHQDGDLELGELLLSEPDTVSQALERESDKAMLADALAALPERQREVIMSRYGPKSLTQTQIAAEMGLSQSYVSRVEKQALANMRAHICQKEALMV